MFLWCHVRHINPSKEHPERIRKIDKKLVKHITNREEIREEDKEFISDLDCDRIEFPVQEKDFTKIEVKNKICINAFGYEYEFCKSCLQCFSSENVLTKHKEDCLSINGKQSVKLEEVIIEFENYFKQIPVPFKIHVDFECNLRGVESYEVSYTKNIQIMFFVVLFTKFFVLMIDLLSQFVIFRGGNAAYDFIKSIRKTYKYCKKVMNKHFNKDLIMSEEEEHLFQLLVLQKAY